MTKKSETFVTGAALLACAGLVGKFVGAFYRIWLSSLIGVDTGMAIYAQPYSIYTILLVVSSAGLPTAISRMVSANIALGEHLAAYEIAKAARRILFGTGLTMSVLMFALARPLASMLGDPVSAPAFMALAPSVFFVCIISSYRGYFQGMQRMTPTALSQLIEQIGKVVIGFPLASYLMRYGFIWGAVGAIAGVSLSELASMMLMLGVNAGQKVHNRNLSQLERPDPHIFRKLFSIAFPITIGSLMMPVVGFVDSTLVLNRLQDAGFTVEHARTMFGALTGIVRPLIDMPTVITIALSAALVPALSSAVTLCNHELIRIVTRTGLKLAILIGLPAAAGLSILAEDIVRFLFGSQNSEVQMLGAQLLSVMGIAVFFLLLIQVSTGIFQGLGHPMLPVWTMGAGIVVKIMMNYFLIATPGVYVLGAAYATLACYVIAACCNLCFVVKLAGMRASEVLSLFRPVFAVMGMALALWGTNVLFSEKLGHSLFLFVAIAVGVIVYLAVILFTRAVTADEMAMLPGAGRIAKLLPKCWQGKP